MRSVRVMQCRELPDLHQHCEEKLQTSVLAIVGHHENIVGWRFFRNRCFCARFSEGAKVFIWVASVEVFLSVICAPFFDDSLPVEE